MKQESDTESSLKFGMSRYEQPRWRTLPARDVYHRARDEERDIYVRALTKLEQEDEEIPLPTERGPVVFRDGVFQIDMSRMEEKGDIDTELKKLIDTIMGV